jgi:hypothetical protein
MLKKRKQKKKRRAMASMVMDGKRRKVVRSLPPDLKEVLGTLGVPQVLQWFSVNQGPEY